MKTSRHYWISQAHHHAALADFRRTPLMESACMGSVMWYASGIAGVLLFIFT